MGNASPHRPVLLCMAVFSRHRAALDWAQEEAEKLWGNVWRSSDVFEFDQTAFYQASMGPGLKKTLLAFEALIDPAELVEIKQATNALESRLAASQKYPEARPVNLDPGYLTEAKLILASTKDRDHRIYLAEGIFAEGTLFFHKGEWKSRPWTYPDYKQPGYHQFFNCCRAYLREKYQNQGGSVV
ncbi:MAG: DUF4416 family protein [Pirellulaceae bacterium]|nr:DUF4416 family protein [Pirellulaceae bacterium]